MNSVIVTCKMAEAEAAKSVLEKYTICDTPTPEMILMLKFSGKLHKAIQHAKGIKSHTVADKEQAND